MRGYKWRAFGSILLFLAGGIVQLIILAISDIQNFNLDNLEYLAQNFLYAGSYWVTLWSASSYNTFWLDKFIPWLKNPLKRTIYSVISIVAFTIIVVTMVDLILDLIFLQKTIEEALSEQSMSYSGALLVTFAINIVMHGRAFLLAWRQSSIDVEQLQTKNVQAQYQSLKNQVNPHFLFNSLNALSSLVYDDQDKAVDFIRKLSSVYRYVLDKKDSELVSVEDELKFTEDFMFLQKIRFGENIHFEVIKKTNEGYLPPLALQLLVENAIKHNVISESYPLTIRITVEHGFCTIFNSKKEKLSKDSTGIGLKNLRARYTYLTKKEIQISDNDDTFKVTLPILNSKHEIRNN
jgi:LytS/YehU family sensor histidine kinase